MAGTDHLETRARDLEADGAAPLRVDLVRRARRFKRSWVEMAEALVEVRMHRSYEAWGFDDFYRYCAEELLIKRRTVDKLTGSYQTLRQHAPDALERGDALPSVDAVSYFNRALERSGYAPPSEASEAGWTAPPDNDPPPIEQLRQAVFEEGRPVHALRKEFQRVLFRKSDDEMARDALEKTLATAERLARLLPDCPGVASTRVAEVAATLDGLIRDLEPLVAARRPSPDAAREAS
ncbi:MAG: hypothetical protein AAGN82_09840 [Myxococcota bacterium]